MPASQEIREARKHSRGIVTRRKILRAAERRFSRAGYEATSLGDVAKACGVAVGSVYYHFSDKRTLLLALMDDLLDHVSKIRPEGLPLEAFAGPNPRTSIETWLRRSYQAFQKRPSISCFSAWPRVIPNCANAGAASTNSRSSNSRS